MSAPQEKARVLVVDDHPMVRDSVRELIRREADLTVCAEADSVADALAIIASGEPQIAVVDVTLKGGSGIDLIARALELRPGFPIVVLSGHDEPALVERALHAGAKGYVLKLEPGQNLLTAIRRVLAGEIYLGADMRDWILNRMIGKRRKSDDSATLGSLSNREFEVFQLLGEGMVAKDIAANLSISVKTVQAHRAHIKEKLNLKARGELTRYAIQSAVLPG